MSLTLDLRCYDKIGISLSSSQQELVVVSDVKAIRMVEKLQSSGQNIPSSFNYFAHILPPETTLPKNIHVTRDHAYTPPATSPQGHHTMNSVSGESTGLVYIEKLRLVNVEFARSPVVPFKYTVTQVDGRMLLKRDAIEGLNEESEYIKSW